MTQAAANAISPLGVLPPPGPSCVHLPLDVTPQELARYAVGSSVEIHAFRRDELMVFSAVLQGERVPGITLTLDPVAKKSAGPLRPSAAR